MVRVRAPQPHTVGTFGFLDVFHGDILLAVDVDREQVHVAPEDVVDVVQLFVKDDVAAFEQRVHRVAPHVEGSVAFGQVRDMDEIDGFQIGVVGEERDESGGSLDRVERDTLQRQRVVGAVPVGGQVGFGVEHLSLCGVEPFGIYIQFLNKDVPVAGRESRLARLDHREGRFPYSKPLSELLLRQAELFSYQFYPFIYHIPSEFFISKIQTFCINIQYLNIYLHCKVKQFICIRKSICEKSFIFNVLFRSI